MKDIKVGKWSIHVQSPYPCWIELTHSAGGGTAEVIRFFHHTELRDLQYAIGRAIHAATEALPDHLKHEME